MYRVIPTVYLNAVLFIQGFMNEGSKTINISVGYFIFFNPKVPYKGILVLKFSYDNVYF